MQKNPKKGSLGIMRMWCLIWRASLFSSHCSTLCADCIIYCLPNNIFSEIYMFSCINRKSELLLWKGLLQGEVCSVLTWRFPIKQLSSNFKWLFSFRVTHCNYPLLHCQWTFFGCFFRLFFCFLVIPPPLCCGFQPYLFSNQSSMGSYVFQMIKKKKSFQK